MGKRKSWAVVMVVLVVSGAAPAGASNDAPRASGVRGATPAVAAAIERGVEESATFRRLVAAIIATDGIVYVHEGRCFRNVFACLLLSVTQAGPNRILHIKIDPRRKGLDLMVTIGHELTHAVEVLSQPDLVDERSVRLYYELSVPTDRLAFETKAAIGNELAVRHELKVSSRQSSVDSHQSAAVSR